MAAKKMKVLGQGLTERGPALLLKDNQTEETVLSVLTKPGEPIIPGSEVVSLEKLDDDHVSCRPLLDGDLVEDWTKDDSVSRSKSGPAQVSNDAYRDGWDRIFAGKDGGAPN